MKKILLPLLALGMFACAPKHDGYIIKATITGLDTATVILSNNARAEADLITDTVQMVKGQFSFKGKISTAEPYSIIIPGEKPTRITIHLENANYTLTADADDLANAIVTGGTYQNQMNQFLAERKALSEEFNMSEMIAEYRKPETTQERKDEIMELNNQMNERSKAIEATFKENNPNSPYVLIQLVNGLGSYGSESSISQLEEQLAQFTALPEYAENRYVEKGKKDIATLKSVQIGMVAPDFTMNDPKGNPISLSDVYKQNKVTMIDFWAAWCVPCRNFNPTLVKLYKEYNKKGFGILGVSYDREGEHDKWVKAIADDKLTWQQVSELKWWDNTARHLYHVNYIPQNVFVDQNGVIIGRCLEGEEAIAALLNEYLK